MEMESLAWVAIGAVIGLAILWGLPPAAKTLQPLRRWFRTLSAYEKLLLVMLLLVLGSIWLIFDVTH